MAAPLLEFHGTHETSVLADEFPIFFGRMKNVTPETIGEPERKREDALERHRRRIADAAAEFRVGHVLEVLNALKESANGPSLLAQNPVPMLGENVEDERNDYRSGQCRPENFHFCFSPHRLECKAQSLRIWPNFTRSSRINQSSGLRSAAGRGCGAWRSFRQLDSGASGS